MKLKQLGGLFKDSYKSWNAKDPFRQSAAIAYYAIFSLPALLVLIINIAGFFFGVEAVNGRVMDQIGQTMGHETANQVKEMLASAVKSGKSIWATIIGVVVLVSGSVGVFIELQKSLNMIWEVQTTKQKGIWPVIRARLFSFGLIMAIGFLLLISLVVSTALAALSSWLNAGDSVWLGVLFHGIDFAISFLVISVLFALMFKILPDVKNSWRDVFVGGMLTGVLFLIGKTAIAFYFGKANPGSGYGAAGSIVLILLWVSYSSMILFFGAEFTKAYSVMRNGKIKPTEIAKKEPPDHKPKAA
jgi:membrane protein